MLISQVKLINMGRFASYSKHAKVSKQYWLSSHDYKVVITPNSYHHIMIMKLIILRLDAANKPSPISEGVMEIRINNQRCKGINLTTRHTQAWRAPRVAKIHDEVKEMIGTHLTLVYVFHAYASTDTPWVTRHYPV